MAAVESLEARMLLSAAPQITAVSPDPLSITEPAGHIYFTITGMNFSLAAAGTNYPAGDAKVVLTAPNGGSADEVQDGEIISFSATSIELSTTDFTMDGLPPGAWTVQVTNADGTASNAFPFAMSLSPPAPVIAGVEPDPLVVGDGVGHVLFNVEGSDFQVTNGDGDSAITLTSPNGDAFNLITDEGANSATELSFNTADFSGEPAGQWTIAVINADGTASNAFAFSVERVAPTITTQPQSQTVTSGADATFSVSATGSGPFAYQWLYDGSSLAGQTAATLTLSNVTAAQAGNYSVVVSNTTGQATSDAAMLAIMPTAGQPPAITTQPQSQTISAGGSVTFTAAATGSSPLQYQWLFNGTTLSGQAAATLTLSNVTEADAGSYAVVVTDSAGSTTSSAAALTVNTVGATEGFTFALSARTVSATAGKKATAKLAIANPTVEKMKQRISIDLLLSPVDNTAGQTAAVREVTRRIGLKPGKSKSISIHFAVPAGASGDYELLARVDGVAVAAPVPLAISPAIKHSKP
jgi:hypothetical protein